MKKVKNVTIDLLAFIVGGLLYAVSINYFTAPNNIAPGGATGVGTILNYLYSLPIGLVSLCINIPLFIWAIIQSGFKIFAKSLLATIVTSVVIDLVAPYIPTYQGDLMLAAIFGGILAGAGLGLIFMRGAATGGSDLAAQLLTKHIRFIPLGRLILIIDVIVIGASAFVYDSIESALYAVVSIFVSTQIIDALLYGFGEGSGKMMFIFSSKAEDISNEIMIKLERGVTLLDSTGAYSKKASKTIMCAVRRSEVCKVRDIVKGIDSTAFIVIGSADEIMGEGFLPMDDRKN